MSIDFIYQFVYLLIFFTDYYCNDQFYIRHISLLFNTKSQQIPSFILQNNANTKLEFVVFLLSDLLSVRFCSSDST